MRAARLLAAAWVITGGCLESRVVTCPDGTVCPEGTVCDPAGAACIDPTGLTVPVGVIDFASLGCGASAELIVPVRNYGQTPIAFQASSTINGVTVMPATGTVAGGASLDLHVVASTQAQSIPGVTAEGSLIITTDAQLLERTVRLTTVGALVTASAQTLDFGETGLAAAPVRREFTLLNQGNARADVALTSPAQPFSLIVPTATQLDPGAQLVFDVDFDPDVIDAFASSVGLDFAGAQCQPPPTGIAVRGLASDVPILIDHTALDFGPVTCGSAAQVLPIELTNNLPDDEALTTTLSGPDAASYTATASATIPAGPTGMRTLDVTRQAIPAQASVGPRTASLLIDVPAAGVMKTVALSEVVTGPVLSLAGGEVDFGGVPKYSVSTRTVGIANTGNAVANIMITPPSYNFGTSRLTVSPNLLQIPPSVAATVTLTLFAGADGPGFSDIEFVVSATNDCSGRHVIIANYYIM